MSDNRWVKVGLPLLIALAAAWWLSSGGKSSEEEAIRKRLAEGKAAWEAQDTEKFMSFFDVTYEDRSGVLNYPLLKEYHLHHLFKDRCQLRADIQGVRIQVAGTKATVTFDATGSKDCSGSGPVYFVGQPGHATPITLELEKKGKVNPAWVVVRSSGAVNADNLAG